MTRVEVVRGNLFRSSRQTLVNPVNCVGVMGAGLALEFKLRYREMFDRYAELCRTGQMQVGKLWLYKDAKPANDERKWVLNFPTKKHWRRPSRMEYLEMGLDKFMETYRKRGITSVAFPLLGARNGGLDEDEVLELMQDRLEPCTAPVEIYRYKRTAKDEWIDRLGKRCLELDPTALAKETGITPKRVEAIQHALERNNVSTVGQLASVRGIGEKTVTSVFAWLRRVEKPTPPLDSSAPSSRIAGPVPDTGTLTVSDPVEFTSEETRMPLPLPRSHGRSRFLKSRRQ